MRYTAPLSLTLALIALLPACQSPAQAPPVGAHGFADEITVFAAWDAKNATPRNPMVFAGSSSIRFWNTSD